MARSREVAVLHGPHLRADRLGELLVAAGEEEGEGQFLLDDDDDEWVKGLGDALGDDEDTAVVVLERRDERSKRLAVELRARREEGEGQLQTSTEDSDGEDEDARSWSARRG